MGWFNGRHFMNTDQERKYKEKLESKKRAKEEHEAKKGEQDGLLSWVQQERKPQAYQGKINIIRD